MLWRLVEWRSCAPLSWSVHVLLGFLMVTIVANKGWGVIRWCIGIQNPDVKHALSDLTPPEASRSNIQTSSTVLLFSSFLKEANRITLTTTSDGQRTQFKSTFCWVLSSTSKFLMQSEWSTLLLYISYLMCYSEPLLKHKHLPSMYISCYSLLSVYDIIIHYNMIFHGQNYLWMWSFAKKECSQKFVMYVVCKQRSLMRGSK